MHRCLRIVTSCLSGCFSKPLYVVVAAISLFLQICSAAYAGVRCWGMLGSESEQSLECCHRGFAAVVSKHELVEVNLELSAAHAVVRANQPLLQVANCAVGQRHYRLCAFPQRCPARLSTRDMFEAGLFEPGEALQTIGVDFRACVNVLSQKRGYRLLS